MLRSVDHRKDSQVMQRWHAKADGLNHTLELTATRIRLSADQGTPESYSGRDLTYPRFLRSERWQEFIGRTFGADALRSVREAAESYRAP